MTLPQFLKTLRAVAATHKNPQGIPRLRLAKLLGVNANTLNHWLHDQHDPGGLAVVALSPRLAKIAAEHQAKLKLKQRKTEKVVSAMIAAHSPPY